MSIPGRSGVLLDGFDDASDVLATTLLIIQLPLMGFVHSGGLSKARIGDAAHPGGPEGGRRSGLVKPRGG